MGSCNAPHLQIALLSWIEFGKDGPKCASHVHADERSIRQAHSRHSLKFTLALLWLRTKTHRIVCIQHLRNVWFLVAIHMRSATPSTMLRIRHVIIVRLFPLQDPKCTPSHAGVGSLSGGFLLNLDHCSNVFPLPKSDATGMNDHRSHGDSSGSRLHCNANWHSD